MSPVVTTSPPSHQYHTTPPIAIIGGGLAGLALAVGLRKHGVRFHIYEAVAALAEIGAGIAFGPNSTRALSLIDPGLIEAYKKHATFNENREHDDTFMSLRWGMDERKEAGAKAGDLMFHLADIWYPEGARKLGVRTRSCIHRARLLDALAGLLPADAISFGKSFESVEESSDGTVMLHFADGTTATASAVVGCDGIKSKAQKIVCGPSVQASWVGEYVWRAMVPKVEAEKALGVELARNGQIYCGYGAYIVTYPVEHGDFTNMAAVYHEPGDARSWDQGEWTTPATRDEFGKEFAGWHPPLVDVIKRHCMLDRWAMFNVEHSAAYYKGRVCLLGDSAHASTPHLGAGAGMAMEDAFILSNLLATVGEAGRYEDAFRAFDSVRRPRTQKLVERSRFAGLVNEFLLPGIGDDVGLIKKHLEDSYKWVWHEDLEAQLEKAKKLM
ncbi:mannitol 1-phosphate dehydrogenase [Pleomassaria siparia CBS 279.74]|uniref:Mannitol 1-phosphate dehydrogenase n=1 Tax=Pleomassaria siparia CBS 279.74 TaxID=1314801 RepID=A0A6G1KJL4_9PLEO|nr:mannitol 1-phosphate dehydrogenase [Pleomassaria siparia CBS 279.74]